MGKRHLQSEMGVFIVSDTQRFFFLVYGLAVVLKIFLIKTKLRHYFNFFRGTELGDIFPGKSPLNALAHPTA